MFALLQPIVVIVLAPAVGRSSLKPEVTLSGVKLATAYTAYAYYAKSWSVVKATAEPGPAADASQEWQGWWGRIRQPTTGLGIQQLTTYASAETETEAEAGMQEDGSGVRVQSAADSPGLSSV